MLTVADAKEFIDSLRCAGLNPWWERELKEKVPKDMATYFSSATREEFLSLADIFKAGDHWPNYKEMLSELKKLRKQAQIQVELAEEESVEAPVMDAYPEGEAWEETTRALIAKKPKNYKPELSPASLLNVHKCELFFKRCKECKGVSCPVNGHRYCLRFSPNGREAYLCVEKAVCKKYHQHSA